MLLSLSLICLIKSDIKCTEQWTEINLPRESWSLVGDLPHIEDSSLSNEYSIEFNISESSLEENTNVGGAVWNSYNLASKRGLRISFKPSIIVDTAYYGNVKYPQGFAIVLTSSSISNLMGNKGSGLGYEGINNGIAFEFDFVRNSDKEDNKKPHFSIHYNMNGEISSKSSQECIDNKICNIILPNFYDNSTVDDYKKNMIFEIEIIGKKLNVKTNTGRTLIGNLEIEIFSQLLEQEEVFIGITSSMNRNKKVTIDEFSLAEISVMEKGELTLGNTVYEAGDTISLFFSIKSTCGELLKIYPNEYTVNNENNSTNLSLIINNNIEKPALIVFNFNDKTNLLRLEISRTKSGTYTALIKFKDNYSSPVQFKVLPSNVQRFEICDEKENVVDDIYISSNIEQKKDEFIVPICSYDQYNNSRTINSIGAKDLFKFLYPQYFTIDKELKFEISREKIDYHVPFSTFGEYRIFNESFKKNSSRIFNLKVNRISSENSDATILYGKHLLKLKEKDKNVTLRIKLRDEFGRDIPNRVTEEMNCSFASSYIFDNNKSEILENTNIEENYLENDIIHLVYRIDDNIKEGKYTFIPKIKCKEDKYDLTLKCSETEDDENNIYDKCAFYLNSGDNTLNNKKIRLYSDFLNDYIIYDKSQDNPDLLISIDEYNNKKLTEINLLDNSDYPMVDPSDYSISCFLNNEELTIEKVGYSIAVILPETREKYDNKKEVTLNITVNGEYYFNVNLKFVSVDKLLNNMNKKDITSNIKTIAIYQQEKYTIEASNYILLFEVFRIDTNNNYLIKEPINIDNFKLTINDLEYKTFIVKEYSVLVFTNTLQKADTYKITLEDDSTKIIEVDINVTPSGIVNGLFASDISDLDEDNYSLTDDYIFFDMKDDFGNEIKDNQAIKAFSEFEITSNGLKAEINMDGKIVVYNENISSKENYITIKLPNNKLYTITKTLPKTQKINPHKTYGILNNNGSSVIVDVYLYDDYGNEITSILNISDINKFNIYAIEKFGNKKKFYPLNYKSTDTVSTNIEFETNINTVGEYEIKIFYDDIHVSCKACHFSISTNKGIEYKNTRLYILGNKRKIPVFMQEEGNSQYLLTSKKFIFNLQFYDKNFNEIRENTQYSLSLYPAEKENNKYVKLCHYANSKIEGKQFYYVCSDQLDKFKELTEGEYLIEVNAQFFSFYVSNTETNSKDSTPVKAIYHQYENETYSTTDSPISLIVDLRNKNNQRINLDVRKISIKLKDIKTDEELTKDYNFTSVLGPDNGLFTLILNIRKIGIYSLEIIYDGKEINSKKITMYISCGALHELKDYKEATYYNGIGTYKFYKVLDINDEICNDISNGSWNVFNNEEYIGNLIKAQDKTKDNIFYSTTKYYNHMSGVFSIVINSEINNDITLSSDLFTFTQNIEQEKLSREKLNKEYIYIHLDSNKQQIQLYQLKKNYEKYSDFIKGENDTLTLNILKYINDETILVGEYGYNNDLKGFGYSEKDIHSPGDYFFVVYLNGEEIPCDECHIKVENDVGLVEFDNTKIFLKDGYNKFFEAKENSKNYIYKSSFPFFKINFVTKDNYLVKLTKDEIDENYSFNIKFNSSEGNLDSNTETTINEYNGNIYVYLNESGKNNYTELSSSERAIILTIKNKKAEDKEITKEFYLFDDYSINDIEMEYEKCNIGAQPVIVNNQSSYVLRADEQKEIEIYLEGCTEQVNNFNDSDLKIEVPGADYTFNIKTIPADTFGNYILLINYNEAILEPVTAYIKYLNGKTQSFQISVLPGYDIKSANVSFDNDLGTPNTNYKYAYALMELKDYNDNIISNIGRNLFINDIKILSVRDSNNNNLPYKLSFNDEKNKFRIEIPINGNGNITIKNKINEKEDKLYIEESQIYHNVNFKMSHTDRNFKFEMNYLDDFYKEIKQPKNFAIKDLSFIYITESYASQEIYSIKIFSDAFQYDENNNEISFQLSDDIPIYNSYSFIPVISGFNQICHNCLQNNTFNTYIYSIHNNIYYPHVFGKDIYLQKNYEYPLYMYVSNDKNVMLSCTLDNIITIINPKNNYHYYVVGLKNNNDKKDFEIILTNNDISKFIKVNLKEDKTIEEYSREMELRIEKYQYNFISFISGNYGKLVDLYFYLDIRNSKSFNPVYISSDFSTKLLSGKTDNKTLIEYLNIFETEIDGNYLVVIPSNKLINGKYTINFLNNNNIVEPNSNSIVFNSLASFPNLILLNNKEMIYKNMIKYDLVGQNDNSELICDERLNIYIEPKSTAKFIKGDIVNKDNQNELGLNSCKLYIKFIGDIKIITSIGEGFSSELTNSDNSLYNINPHYSQLNINPNIIINDDNNSTEINIEFNERSSDDLSFSTDEMPVDKVIKSIRYMTSTKYELKQSISGLFSSKYTFSPSQLKIKELGTYLILGSISNNGIEKPTFISYIKKQNKTIHHFNIKYSDNKLWTSIDNILKERMSASNTDSILSFKYPFKLSLNLKDNYDSLVRVDKKVNASIVANSDNRVNFNISLEVTKINDYEFIIRPNSSNIEKLIHMETKNIYNKFFIEFIYDDLKNYVLLDSKNENNLHPRVSQKGYGIPGQIFSSGYYLVNEYEFEQNYYVIPNAPNSEVYCFVNNNMILNDNIDIRNLSCLECNVSFANSYRGCIKIGANNNSKKTLEISYNGQNLEKSLNIISLDPSTFNFELDIEKEVEVIQNETFDYVFKQNSEVDEINSKYFSVYLNGQKLKKSEYTFKSNSKKIEISSVNQLFLSTLIPRKIINVIYSQGRLDYEIGEVKLKVNQNSYSPKNTEYKYSAQVPVHFKAGDTPYFYLIIKNLENACFYEENSLSGISQIIGTLTSRKDTVEFIINVNESLINLNDVPTCEYIYKFYGKTQIRDAGLFDIDVNMPNSKSLKTQIYISPGGFFTNSLDLKDSTKKIYAGDTFGMIFKTKDVYENSPNYYDIIEHFEIKLFDISTEKEIDEASIKYKKINVSKSIDEINDQIEITMIVTKSGTYFFKIYYDEEEIPLSYIKITIHHKDCSFYNPTLDITKIDNRNITFYSGEEIEINIYCSDQYGNLIENQGEENFKAIVNNTGNIITSEHKFDKIHKIYFTTENEGNYTIQVLLNGKIYSKPIDISVFKFNESLFMCMDKIQVNDLKECIKPDYYEELIKGIEGQDNICTNDEYENGRVFKCTIKEDKGKCTENTNNCDCDENYKKFNGYCYPKDVGPIDLVKENINKANCLSILEGKGITDAKMCEDGSCRLDEKFCNTTFECPIGFKSCGNNCILLNQKCDLKNTCNNNEVLCWDYSCSSSYSLCPTRKTCPTGKNLCPDGTCQNPGHCPQPILRQCSVDKPYQCPDFTCVKNKNDCHKNKVCPEGQSLCEDDNCRDSCENNKDKKYKCSNGLYVDNSQLCPSEIQCPLNWIKCPLGGCSQSKDGCKFIKSYNNLVCPKDRPILCPDYECVSTFSQCKTKYPICPPHKPYKCWNNECRKSFSECPTEISCPENTPLLCANGLCVNSINNCHVNKGIYEGCSDSNKIRCFDGSCASSIELCPTHSYCGNGKIKCWNGACVDSITNCLSSENLEPCSSDFPYRCPDGTCRKEQNSCSSIIICPNALPVKCFDNSCRATIDECPEYHSCGINKVSCPDGTCADNFDECNTVVTCQSIKPFLCYDGSCRGQLEECPLPPSCGNKYVQCPDGSCTTSRQSCKLFSPCEAKTPVRCEMNICAEEIDKCYNNDRQCPMGYVQCSNGDCKIMSSLCEENICPSNAPYKCPEGVCVHNKDLCDNSKNGCPHNRPQKCGNGTCVENINECINIDSNYYCPDGSEKAVYENMECPEQNGCPKDRPLKCADGTCINPTISECSPVYCPREKPIKCLNGLCVVKSSDCFSIPKSEDFVEDNQIICLDGRKVPSYDYCRPTFNCPNGYVKCQDDSCRIDEKYCPKNIACPPERPFKIENENICSISPEDSHLYCPKNTTRKCDYTGECMKIEDYENGKCSGPIIQNGCPEDNQIRCDNGRCIDQKFDCNLISKACPDDYKPFLCNNGECVSDLKQCSNDNDDNCKVGFIRCFNGRCVEDNEESYLNNCTNEIGCPLNKPYRCANGECVTSQRKCEIFSERNSNITLNTICDSSKPYLCSDYSCESDYNFCKLTLSCSEGLYKCFNGYCVENEEDCQKYKNYCPQSNPIKCPSGSCTTDILKCSESFPQLSCQEGEFYCSRLGKCVTTKSECWKNYQKKTNKVYLTAESNKVLCYDGTVAETYEKCPIVPSCKVGQYRCENGACAYNQSLCIKDEEYICEGNQQKCPDGMCHENCSEVAYQGCLVGEYLCSNGMCVKSELYCVGFSMCEDPSVPYRCINGECKSDIALCPEVGSLSVVRNISYSFNKDNKIEFDFAFDPKGRRTGRILIPSKGIILNTNYSKINIEEVSKSLVISDSLYNNTDVFLYNVSNGIEGSEGILNAHNSIMSPVFKFYSEVMSDIKFNIPALLILEHNTIISSSFNYYDYCLAKLSNFDIVNDKINYNGQSKWICIQRLERDDQKDFKLDEFGVYAIILNPSRNKVDYFEGDEKAFYNYIKYILIFLSIIFLFGWFIVYIFSRVMRYRGKYKENLSKINILKQQKEEFKQMQTDVFGQSLGDNLIGIVYSKNPGFNEEDGEMKDDGGLENEIEEIQRQCRNMELQNAKLKENLGKLEEEYKQVSAEIELIKNNNQ